MIFNFTPIGLFESWLGYSGSIPEIYWNVYSEEQRYKFLCKQLQMLVEYAEEIGMQVNANSEAIEELAQELATFKDPETWDEAFKDVVDRWIANNLEYIFTNVAKQVFFGLTYDPNNPQLNGRFCAYIPESWSDITFDTGTVYGQFDYGRLLLRFNVDGAEGVIDNTGRYDETEIEQLKLDVEQIKHTLYTILGAGGN